MAHEKQYTARQASLAVLEKVNKLLEDSRVYAQLQDLEKKEGKVKMSSKERQIRAKVGLPVGKAEGESDMEKSSKPPAIDPVRRQKYLDGVASEAKVAEHVKNHFESKKAAAVPAISKCDKCGSDMKKGEEAHDCVEKAESGHEKGIHVSATRKAAGKSHVGAIVEGAHEVREHGGTGIKNPDGVAKVREDSAKKMHRNVLSEMRSMPSPDLGKAEPKGEIHPKEHVEGETVKPGARIEAQKNPQHNPKEQAEGNNELAGTTPTQVGQDGKNVPGGDEIKSHLKLAKWIGRMEHKRSLKDPIVKAETGHEKGVHTARLSSAPGESSAGYSAEVGKNGGAKMVATGSGQKKQHSMVPVPPGDYSDSKKQHSAKLSELKGMSNPKLPK